MGLMQCKWKQDKYLFDIYVPLRNLHWYNNLSMLLNIRYNLKHIRFTFAFILNSFKVLNLTPKWNLIFKIDHNSLTYLLLSKLPNIMSNGFLTFKKIWCVEGVNQIWKRLCVILRRLVFLRFVMSKLKHQKCDPYIFSWTKIDFILK